MTANYVTVEPNKVIVQLHSPYGPRGRGWFSGNGTPDNDVGKPGDFYIDLDTQRYFGPKTEEGWPLAVLHGRSNSHPLRAYSIKSIC